MWSPKDSVTSIVSSTEKFYPSVDFGDASSWVVRFKLSEPEIDQVKAARLVFDPNELEQVSELRTYKLYCLFSTTNCINLSNCNFWRLSKAIHMLLKGSFFLTNQHIYQLITSKKVKERITTILNQRSIWTLPDQAIRKLKSRVLKDPIYSSHNHNYQINSRSPFLEVDFHRGYTPYKIPKRSLGGSWIKRLIV